MRIKISALGPLHDEVQFELKPLTIFIGPNNSGKTLLAYTLAALFGKFGIRQFTSQERRASILENYPPVASAVNGLLKTGLVTIDIYQFANAYGEKYFQDIISTVSKNLSQFMGTRLISFDALHISAELNNLWPPFLQRIQDTAFQAPIPIEPNKQESHHANEKPNAPFIISKQKGQNNISIYLTFEDKPEAEIQRETLRAIIEEHIIWHIFRTLHRALFSNVVVLPTERTTFLTLPFSTHSPDDQEINHIRDQRPLSIPVSDYISSVISVAAIGAKETAKRKLQAEKDPQVQKLIDLSYVLETDILNGEVDLSTPDPDIWRDIIFHPKNSTSPLEISLASSMVKELAPLVFHLRYFAQPNELLIIDEPEMNLHPTAQVQVLELLSMLVNTGINVLVTTHSPYMIDHLGNITQAYQYSDKERIKDEFFLKDCKAFIDENKVSTYLIDKGTLRDAFDEELEGDTFGDVSNRTTQIYFLSYQKSKEHPLDDL
jgi:AAA ATPase domain